MSDSQKKISAIEWQEKTTPIIGQKGFTAEIPIEGVGTLEFLQTDRQSSMRILIEPHILHHPDLGPATAEIDRSNLLAILIRRAEEVLQKLRHLEDRERWAEKQDRMRLWIDLGPEEQACRDCGTRIPANQLNYCGQCRGCQNAARSAAAGENW